MAQSKILPGLYVFFALLGFLFFQGPEGPRVIHQSLSLLRGHFFDFYDYNNKVLALETVHFPPLYWLYALWALPLHLFTGLGTATKIEELAPYYHWFKLLTLLFYGGCVLYLGKIAGLLGGSESQGWQKRIQLVWLTHPISFFLGFYYYTYDFVHTFFGLLGLHALMLGRVKAGAFWFGVGAMFKNTPLIYFLPILFLRTKDPWQILKAIVLMFLPQLLIRLVYHGNETFAELVLGSGELKRIFVTTLFIESPGNGNQLCLFLLAWFALCLIAYLARPQSEGRLRWGFIQLGLAAATLQFGLVHWHVHWVAIALPFLCLLWLQVRAEVALSIFEIALGGFFLGFMLLTWEHLNFNLDWGPLVAVRGMLWPAGRSGVMFRLPFRFPDFYQAYFHFAGFVAVLGVSSALASSTFRGRLNLSEVLPDNRRRFFFHARYIFIGVVYGLASIAYYL